MKCCSTLGLLNSHSIPVGHGLHRTPTGRALDGVSAGEKTVKGLFDRGELLEQRRQSAQFPNDQTSFIVCQGYFGKEPLHGTTRRLRGKDCLLCLLDIPCRERCECLFRKRPTQRQLGCEELQARPVILHTSVIKDLVRFSQIIREIRH